MFGNANGNWYQIKIFYIYCASPLLLNLKQSTSENTSVTHTDIGIGDWMLFLDNRHPSFSSFDNLNQN